MKIGIDALSRYLAARCGFDERAGNRADAGLAGAATGRPPVNPRLSHDRVFFRPLGQAAHQANRTRSPRGCAGGVQPVGHGELYSAAGVAVGVPHSSSFRRATRIGLARRRRLASRDLRRSWRDALHTRPAAERCWFGAWVEDNASLTRTLPSFERKPLIWLALVGAVC